MSVNAASISRILNNAGIKKSKTLRGRVVSNATEGFEARKNWKGEIEVTYIHGSWNFAHLSDFATYKAAKLVEIAQVLSAKGYTTTTGEWGLVVSEVA